MTTEREWSPSTAFEALLDALDEGVVLYDAGRICRRIGRRAAELFGLEVEATLGMARAELVAKMAAASDEPAQLLAAVGDPARSTVADPVHIHRPRPRTLVWTSVALGVEGAHIDVVRDVTRERRAEDEALAIARRLDEETTLDGTTGLLNRRRFEHECDREHRRAQRAWDSYALARIDVDGMGAVNSTHGSAAGDELLRRVGEELRKGRREYDVAARWEGDEFILLLPGADGRAVRTVLSRMVRGLAERTFDVAGGLRITVTAGAAVWAPPSGEGAADMIRRAGDALEIARRSAPSGLEVDIDVGRWKDDAGEL